MKNVAVDHMLKHQRREMSDEAGNLMPAVEEQEYTEDAGRGNSLHLDWIHNEQAAEGCPSKMDFRGCC